MQKFGVFISSPVQAPVQTRWESDVGSKSCWHSLSPVGPFVWTWGLSALQKYLHSQRKNKSQFGCTSFTVYYSLHGGFSQNILPLPLLPCQLQLQTAKRPEGCSRMFECCVDQLVAPVWATPHSVCPCCHLWLRILWAAVQESGWETGWLFLCHWFLQHFCWTLRQLKEFHQSTSSDRNWPSEAALELKHHLRKENTTNNQYSSQYVH